jgi:tetratricopeptide (TPR) repeat protein
VIANIAQLLRSLFDRLRQRSAIAGQRSVAAGRDIIDSTIVIGLNEEETAKLVQSAQRPLAESLDALAAQIASEKGLPVPPFRAILARLGEDDVSDIDIPKRLEKVANQLLDLRTRLQGKDDDHLSTTKREALALIDSGDLRKAFDVLERGRWAARNMREKATQSEAELLADQARIDELRLFYRAAAMKYREAANLVSVHPDLAFGFLAKQATALQNQGEEFGDNDAIRDAIAIWKEARALRPFDIAPDDFRKANNNLGSATYALGIRESDNGLLEETLALAREAVVQDKRDADTKYWIAAQNNLGAVLQALGERSDSVEMFTEAIARFRSALGAVDKGSQPAMWAGIQNNIGNALKFIAERQASDQLFEEAILAHRDALSILPHDCPPFERSMIMSNLGAALADLGRLRNRAEPLEEAIAVCHDALSLISRERFPIQWGIAKNNVGSALNSLGIVKNEIAHFRDARLACHEALSVFARDDSPIHWANCIWGIGIASKLIAERTRDMAESTSAVSALTMAKQVIAGSGDQALKPRIDGALAEAITLQNALRAVTWQSAG